MDRRRVADPRVGVAEDSRPPPDDPRNAARVWRQRPDEPAGDRPGTRGLAVARVPDRDEGPQTTPGDHGMSEPSVCTYCGGTGRVIVPHPKYIKDNFWKPVRKMLTGKPH